MVGSRGENSLQSQVCKTVQSGQPLAAPMPSQSVLCEVLRTLEEQCERRGLIKRGAKNHYPLWFLVETERNIFLWRRGLSLADADSYEFWVDPFALLEKRIQQLEVGCLDNPFLNPDWEQQWGAGQTGSTNHQSQGELDYLMQLAEQLNRMISHAHALSHIASELKKEARHQAQEQVLLPYRGIAAKPAPAKAEYSPPPAKVR